MLNIVIIGASGLGHYIASLLSKEDHNVILIDENQEKLERVARSMDVATRLGSGTDWQLMDDLLDLSPDFLVALTNSDETNVTACAIAKNLGYPHTIARVKDNRFLNRTRLDFSRIFDVDTFVGPEVLVAHDLLKYMNFPGSLVVENFAHGAVQLQTIQINHKWEYSHVPLMKLPLPKGVMVGLISREVDGNNKVIFPHGQDRIQSGDEVTFIGKTAVNEVLHTFLHMEQKAIHSAVLVGGSRTAINLAALLTRRKVSVRIIEKEFDRCQMLAEELPECTIIHHDATDIDFLRAEKVGRAEAFVACTESDEVNLLSALLAKEVGCKEVQVVLGNPSYSSLAQRLGVKYVASPRISASNHILSRVFSKTVTSLVSFYENRAEVMEIQVSRHSPIVGIPLSELGPLFPKDFLIAIIQNRGRIMVAHGSRVISPGDSVIVIADPKHIPELEKIF